jgi:hypothetical protein
MNSIATAIACQLHAIRDFAECDNPCADDYIQLRNAAREARTALDQAIARAKDREIIFREYGYLPHDGGDAA